MHGGMAMPGQGLIGLLHLHCHRAMHLPLGEGFSAVLGSSLW